MSYILDKTYGLPYYGATSDLTTMRLDANGMPYYSRPATLQEKQVVLDAVLPTVETRRPVIVNIDNWGNNGYAFIYYGVPEPQLPPEEKTFKTKSSNAPFRKRSLEKAILMSDYSVGQLKVSYKNGAIETGPTNTREVYLRIQGFANPTITVVNGSFTYYLLQVGENRYVDIAVNSFAIRRGRFGVTDVSPKPSWPYSITEIIDNFKNYEIDSGIVTSALASANKGEMDILTSIVEIPETISSVISGFKLVAKASKAAKNKEFSVSQAFEKRKKFLKRVFDEDMAKLARLHGNARSKREKRIIEKQKQLRQRTFRKAMDDSLNELTTALASIWMNFRYNIMTNVYMIQDAFELLAKLFTEFVSSREKTTVNSSFPTPEGWTVSTEVEELHRVLVKSRYDASGTTSQQLARHASANLAQTLWELTSRSFVIDWFLNIGDLLIALLGLDLSEERKTCYSVKIPLSMKFIHKQNNAEVVLQGQLYYREVINPVDHIGLRWEPNVTFFRQIDALAMLWPSIRKLLRNSK